MSVARDLLVASAGGHLAQLHLLADRLTPQQPRTWVTYDHPQAASLLDGEEVVIGHGPSSRSLGKAVRNWSLARRLLATGRYTRVISTGSAIAVPFLLEAARRGLETHYVESATRVAGPSLSGRILHATSRTVSLHTQHDEWSTARWRSVPSVFHGFEVVAGKPHEGALHVMVSLGTHRFPFDRLVEHLPRALRAGDRVLVQHGATSVHALPGRVEVAASMTSERFATALADADVIVAHAGTGVALSALSAGRRPVLVPRRAAYGEHVDDHQVGTARELAGRGLALSVEPEQLDRETLQVAAGDRVRRAGAAVPLRL